MGQQVAFIVLIILNAMILFQSLIINSKIDRRFEELKQQIKDLKGKE